MKNFLNKFINILCVLIIVVAVILLATMFFSDKNEQPSLFGYSLFRVVSESMEPEIPVDSFIVVKEAYADDIVVGDIITFYSSDPSLNRAANTHRVIGIEYDEAGKPVFTTQGDNNRFVDEYKVGADDLIGTVVAVSAFLGKFISLISNPIIFALLIVIPLSLIAFINIKEVLSVARKLEVEEEKEVLRKQIADLRAQKKAQQEAAAAAEAAEEEALAKEVVPEKLIELERNSIIEAETVEDLYGPQDEEQDMEVQPISSIFSKLHALKEHVAETVTTEESQAPAEAEPEAESVAEEEKPKDPFAVDMEDFGFSMPSFNMDMSGFKVEMPADAAVNASNMPAAGDFDFKPVAEPESTNFDFSVPEMKFDMPEFKMEMPDFDSMFK